MEAEHPAAAKRGEAIGSGGKGIDPKHHQLNKEMLKDVATVDGWVVGRGKQIICLSIDRWARHRLLGFIV
ncbi:hypothetical protein MUK42_27182 [Musa troglodytarum]|uniref:Uncharacterized protein n=1 Tax=Musa troglodytarum TaxID=320322 RepID=A0A9E7JVQ0_9LILI|nr:hypothetical protein MUK42_27182 [Musa troglodytarum]